MSWSQKIALSVLVALALLALTSGFTASEEGLLSYGPATIDKSAMQWQPPGSSGMQKVHLLGTTKLGKDVAAGLIYGARAALVIGVVAVLLALMIGLLLGMTAGYFGDQRLRLTGWQAAVLLLLVIASVWFFGAAIVFTSLWDLALAILSLAGLFLLLWRVGGSGRWALPWDSIVSKSIEIRRSIPLLYLLVLIGAILPRHTLWSIGLVIGVTCWTGIARHSRALVLELRGELQHDALVGLSTPVWRIIVRHFLPQIWPQIRTLAIFLFGTAVLLEASLSFLGLGLPSDTLTWGSMLAECREKPSAWWMAVLPGGLLSITLICLNTLSRDRNRLL